MALADNKTKIQALIAGINALPDAGSGGIGGDVPPEDWGLPVLYLSGDCTNISKDDYITLAYTFGEQSGDLDIKLQGSSSIEIGAEIGGAFDNDVGGLFNFTLKFPNDFVAKEGWGAHKKYVFKVNAIDHTHARNVCSCKLWGQMVKSRTNAPNELKNLVNGGAIDGFPILVVLNGKFYALGTFNIPKEDWMFISGGYAPKAIVAANTQPKGDYQATGFYTPATMEPDKDFEIEYIDESFVHPEFETNEWVKNSINKMINILVNVSNANNYVEKLSPYIDLDSAMDYYIHAVYENAEDCATKNYLLVTFDGVKWYFSAYDRDSTYGLHWAGRRIISPKDGVLTFQQFAWGHLLMWRIYSGGKAALKARAQELRETVLSQDNVTKVFCDFVAGIPSEVYAQNARRWPLLRCTSVSTLDRVVDWYRNRCVMIDAELDALQA